jgi:CheY-like chemotaxis protein
MSDETRVLLVEDNEQNAYLATFLLNKAGIHVTRAASGSEGLRLARGAQHHAILLDIQLPDLDGYELARILRQEQAFDRVALVALTSFAMPNERKKAFEAGCNGYIEKPIEALTFAEQVRAFIKDYEDSNRR